MGEVIRRDLIPAALIIAVGIAGFTVGVHRLPAEMAYAATLGDQRPAVPQFMADAVTRKGLRGSAPVESSATKFTPGQLASYGRSSLLPTPGISSLSCGQRSQQGGATRLKPRPRWRKELRNKP